VANNVTINNLLPGLFATDRLISNIASRARATNRDAESMSAEMEANVPAGRFGDPAEFGEACAFLCAARSGYITGQNLLIDGGTYPGVF